MICEINRDVRCAEGTTRAKGRFATETLTAYRAVCIGMSAYMICVNQEMITLEDGEYWFHTRDRARR